MSDFVNGMMVNESVVANFISRILWNEWNCLLIGMILCLLIWMILNKVIWVWLMARVLFSVISGNMDVNIKGMAGIWWYGMSINKKEFLLIDACFGLLSFP